MSIFRRSFFRVSAALFFLLFAGQALADTAKPGEARPGWSFREAGLIPIQSGGRIKPFDTYARETVAFLTGRASYQGWNSVDLVLSWITAPILWNERAFIRVAHPEVRRQLLLDEKRTYFSPQELFDNAVLRQYVSESDGLATQEEDRRRAPREQELRRVVERVILFRNIVSGSAFTMIPSSDAGTPWGPLASYAQKDAAKSPVADQIAQAVRAYFQGDRDAFEKDSAEAARQVEAAIPQWSASLGKKLKGEYFYHSTQPFFKAMWLYFLAFLLWVVVLSAGESRSQSQAMPRFMKRILPGVRATAAILTIAGALLHVFGFALRSWLAGRPPVSNMYESVIWVSFGILFFAAVIYITQRQAILIAVACFLSAFSLLAADASPIVMDPSIHPLVPVLRSNLWLTIHVLTITISYSALALSLGISNVALYHFGWSKNQSKALALNALSYRAVQFGVVLLAAGTILGGVWADYSWGRFWGWDPKEVWALIALLAYVVILHGRFAGWVGQFGFALWTVVGFLSVLMAWYGVNFVLGVGLHSYGMASGGGVWVASFVLLQLAYVGAAAWSWRKGNRKRR